MSGLPYFSHPMQAAWIAEHGDLPLEQVDAVLTVEWEYMVATGIADKPPGAPEWNFRYYQRGPSWTAPLDTWTATGSPRTPKGSPVCPSTWASRFWRWRASFSSYAAAGTVNRQTLSKRCQTAPFTGVNRASLDFAIRR